MQYLRRTSISVFSLSSQNWLSSQSWSLVNADSPTSTAAPALHAHSTHYCAQTYRQTKEGKYKLKLVPTLNCLPCVFCNFTNLSSAHSYSKMHFSSDETSRSRVTCTVDLSNALCFCCWRGCSTLNQSTEDKLQLTLIQIPINHHYSMFYQLTTLWKFCEHSKYMYFILFEEN